MLTSPEDFSDVRLKLEEEGIAMASAEVTMIPQTYVDLTKEEDIKNIQKTLDLLDEDDDVQDVYHNWNEPEEDEEYDDYEIEDDDYEDEYYDDEYDEYDDEIDSLLHFLRKFQGGRGNEQLQN